MIYYLEKFKRLRRPIFTTLGLGIKHLGCTWSAGRQLTWYLVREFLNFHSNPIWFCSAQGLNSCLLNHLYPGSWGFLIAQLIYLPFVGWFYCIFWVSRLQIYKTIRFQRKVRSNFKIARNIAFNFLEERCKIKRIWRLSNLLSFILPLFCDFYLSLSAADCV